MSSCEQKTDVWCILGRRQASLLICFGLVFVTFAAFEPIRHNDFVSYDDAMYVTENPSVNEGFSVESVLWAFTTTHASNWHPLTWLSHMLDCELFGLRPFWHHFVNLLFHTANTVLLFWVLARMTGEVWASAFVAALFAVHPLHVESVAWAAERKDVLSGFFWMLGMLCYVRYVERPGAARYMVLLLVFALGLMAKPMVVTLPFVLLLLDYWPLNRLRMSTTLRLVGEKWGLFVLAAASCAVTYIAQETTGATEMVAGLPLSIRAGNAFVSYVVYLWRLVYPRALAVLYPHPGTSLAMWQVIGSAVVLALVTAGTIYFAGRGKSYAAVGWLWYLGTLVPVVGLVQVGRQAMADRYMYLPSIGVFIILAWGMAELLGRLFYRKVVLATAAFVVLGVSVLCTRVQVGYWQNDLTLYRRALAVTENNAFMHYSLGDALRQAGRLEEAVKEYRAALRIEPGHTRSHGNLGNALYLLGRVDEAIEHYRRAVEADSNYINARYNLGLALSSRGEYEEAMSQYRRVLEAEPDNAAALNSMAWILCTHPDVGRRDALRAISLARRAAELTEYKKAEVLDTLATSYAEAGQFEQAERAASLALELAVEEHNEELAGRVRGQLELYEKRMHEK